LLTSIFLVVNLLVAEGKNAGIWPEVKKTMDRERLHPQTVTFLVVSWQQASQEGRGSWDG
jgi:hypothetical protein